VSTSTHYLLSIDEPVGRGWIVIYEEDHGDAIAIRSVIRQWCELNWANQTYYRAKYGFDKTGVLDLSLPLVKAPRSLDSGCFRRNFEPGEFVTPDVALPGSNARLQAILEQSRIEVHYNRYDDTALLHIGPDSSLILTNVAGWGPHRIEPYIYAELDDKYVCYWENSIVTWCPELPYSVLTN
jgi:hypothetical protein